VPLNAVPDGVRTLLHRTFGSGTQE
jgi:hypothetical protein